MSEKVNGHILEQVQYKLARMTTGNMAHYKSNLINWVEIGLNELDTLRKELETVKAENDKLKGQQGKDFIQKYDLVVEKVKLKSQLSKAVEGLNEMKADIYKNATDTIWISDMETMVDRIDSLLQSIKGDK